jgi:hypothetical protein
VRRFIKEAETKQGSLSRELVKTGNWWGERLGSAINWVTGADAEAERLERQRLRVLQRREEHREAAETD